MGGETELEEELATLERTWESITAIPEDPRSLMSVIEYGLGKQKRAEVYVNRLMTYLLDPEQPHRMGTDFLAAFLDGLPAECDFDEDTYDLSDVRVNEQVTVREVHETEGSDERSSPGYLDLLLDVPNEWFLMIELKFSAEETGTQFYCRCTQIGDQQVADYESGRYYLYLHDRTRPEARGKYFANWTWANFVDDVLTPFIGSNAARYPQRTVTQLHDLRDDLQELTNMTSHRDRDHEKVALFLNHYEAIEDVATTFDEAWGAYRKQWPDDLVTNIDQPEVSVDTRADETVSAVDVDRDDEQERWYFLSTRNDWQHVFKRGWRKSDPDRENLIRRADDHSDFRIGFYHRMDDSHRDTVVRERELKFNFRCMGSNPTEFRNIFNRRFDERTEEIERLLPRGKTELTGQKRTMIEGTYEIRVDDHDTIFDAYTVALNDAFTNLVVGNEELVRTLTELFDESIEAYL